MIKYKKGGVENMEKQYFKFLSSNKKTTINAIRWVPDNDIVAILQISHGMVEFIDRYDDFANFLSENGILVVGHDHLGHGDSVNDKSEWGYFAKENSPQHLINDMHTVTIDTKKLYPEVPYFILGHSMGSFITRYYLTQFSNELDGVIICGTGQNPKAQVIGGKVFARIVSLLRGWTFRCPIIDKMAFGGMNKGIDNPRTDKDWLTRDPDIVDKYLNDERCSFMFTVNGYYNLFDIILKVQQDKYTKQMNMNLPISLIAGDKDPVGNNGKSILKVYEMYKRIGVQNIDYTLYEGYRHEILNEVGKEVVYNDVLQWILNHI